MIDYSFIISYRDRETHLTKLLPRLKELMDDTSYEIIIAEQDDSDKFQKNSLYNIAALKAKGKLLVFHDVDYYPTDNVSYYTEEDTPLYPVRQVVFLDSEDNMRPTEDIPLGYRNFSSDVGDHSGGVFVLSKALFLKTKGLNPYFKGWGKEDDATRDKLRLLGYQWNRNPQGLFYALYHTDNKPSEHDQDFINNTSLYFKLNETLNLGYDHVTAEVESYSLEEKITWLKIKNFKYENLN